MERMRSIWKGSIAFGLVNVPVKVYSATEDHDIRFHQVHAKDGGRIKYNRVCSECGNVVQYADIDKAYDSDDGVRVVLTDDDFGKLPAAEKHEIPVLQFVPTEQIDPFCSRRVTSSNRIRALRRHMSYSRQPSRTATARPSSTSPSGSAPDWPRCVPGTGCW